MIVKLFLIDTISGKVSKLKYADYVELNMQDLMIRV